MAFITIRGLAAFLTAFKLFCKYQEKFGNDIRPHIPDEHKTAFDNLRTAANAFCVVVKAIDVIGDGVGAQ